MKEAYLNTLKEALIKAGIENVDDILSIYENRFKLGYEANMSDEEIISMLEDIDQIVAQEKKKKNPELNKREYVSSLDLTFFSSFTIEHDAERGISLELEKGSEKYVRVERNENSLSIVNCRNVNFLHGRQLRGTMKIGPDVSFQSLTINNLTGDVFCCDLEGKNLLINNTSGDLKLNQLKFEKMKFSNISGDFYMQVLQADALQITNVSGDFSIGELKAKESVLKTTSGDIDIQYADDGQFELKSVSGDICIRKGAIDLNRVKASSISGDISICGKLQEDILHKIKIEW